jgi:replicative DNA helicase
METVTEWQESPLEDGEVRGLPTGLRAIDKMLGGLMPGYYLVAGRPSMGKTALLLQMLDGLCSAGVPCLLFSIEMSDQDNLRRIACRRAGVSKRRLERGKIEREEYGRVVHELGVIADWPLVICDDSVVRPMDVLAKARRFIIENGELGAVFLDGIWLMTPESRRENRTQTVGSISRSVKRIQRELDVPLVAAHQLSRSCESRGDKRPILSDLRDSGDLEQDADVVMMLYRDVYYNPDTEDQNIAEVWIRKNRIAGPTGEVAKFFWRARLMEFMPLEPREAPIDF